MDRSQYFSQISKSWTEISKRPFVPRMPNFAVALFSKRSLSDSQGSKKTQCRGSSMKNGHVPCWVGTGAGERAGQQGRGEGEGEGEMVRGGEGKKEEGTSG
eukprot:764888-Hanusia_phi.AAC.6